jgi:CPA1 family monovalent cation:H+ antiporter
VPFGPALLTGAILSATDPLAVVAVFRRLPVPRTLATIVECESLFNDAVAVVLYRAMLVAVAAGAVSAGSIAVVTLQTVAGALGGIALGIALAFVVARALHGRSAAVQIAATMICAYGAYFAADYAHLSGIFATIAAGVAVRFFERSWITLEIAGDVNRFWDVAALVANVVVFFMAGAALEIGRLSQAPVFTIATLAGVAVARAAVGGLLIMWPYPREWVDVVRVAGMRGALCLALALALPAAFPNREAIVDATFAVVLATLIVSSLALDSVVRRASLRQTPSG